MEPHNSTGSFRDEVNQHEATEDLMDLKLLVCNNMFSNLNIEFGEGYTPDAMFTITEFLTYAFLHVRDVVGHSVSEFNALMLSSYEAPTVKMNINVGDVTENGGDKTLPLRIELGFVVDRFLIDYDSNYKTMNTAIAPFVEKQMGEFVNEMLPLCMDTVDFMTENLPAPTTDSDQ